MPHNPNTWLELVQSWWRGDTPLGAVIMSIVMAGLRIAYFGGGGGWKRKTLEILLCGALTLTFASALEYVGYQTGRLARSIGYMVPRASKKRAGFMTRIAPNQRNGKGNRMISGDFYPAFLFFGVRGGAKRRRSHHRGASGGSGWRLAPRNNFMVETLEKNRSWTRYFLARELRKSLKPERRHR